MELVRVNSTNVNSIGYEPQNKNLEVKFHNNKHYKYFNVPAELHKNLMLSISKGKFLHRYVYGKFVEIKLN